MNIVSGAQCRMARGLLNWSVSELAQRAGLGTTTIKRLESVDAIPNVQTATLEAIHQAFTSTGRVRFDGLAGVYALGINALPALGVRRRRHLSRIARDRLLPSGMNRPTCSHGFFMGTALPRLWEQKTLYYS